MIIENKDRKPLIEMTDEEIVAIVRGKAAGKVEVRFSNDTWSNADQFGLALNSIYRLVPTYTPITVDWSVLDDSIQWIAADSDGTIVSGTDATRIYPNTGGQWIVPKGQCFYVKGIIKSLKRGDIPWDQSLIKRPEGV